MNKQINKSKNLTLAPSNESKKKKEKKRKKNRGIKSEIYLGQ